MVSSVSSTSANAASGLGFPIQGRAQADATGKRASKTGLSEQDQARLQDLRKRDTEVRAHETAHLAVAGSYAIGGMNLQLTRGPDGGLYATGGEVQIDTSPVSGDPAATIRKAETVKRAALAPASPSPQDQRVAAAATQMQVNAQMELAQKAQGKNKTDTYSAIAAGDSKANTLDHHA